jgi:molecular chaperone GrpE (heat shock protein)
MEAAENERGTTAATESSEMQQLQERVREEHQMYLRALADFENYRRRVEGDCANTAAPGEAGNCTLATRSA